MELIGVSTHAPEALALGLAKKFSKWRELFSDATLAINIFVSVYEFRIGKKLNSQILISDSMHTRSDIYVSIGVLVTLISLKLGFPPIIDPISSLVVAGFTMHATYEIFKENSEVLVDKSVVDEGVIRSIVMGFEEVKDTHNIRSRGSINDLHIDLHILVNSDLNIEKSHKLVHDIEDAIKAKVNESMMRIVPKPLMHLVGKIYFGSFRKKASKHIKKQNTVGIHPYDCCNCKYSIVGSCEWAPEKGFKDRK